MHTIEVLNALAIKLGFVNEDDYLEALEALGPEIWDAERRHKWRMEYCE